MGLWTAGSVPETAFEDGRVHACEAHLSCGYDPQHRRPVGVLRLKMGFLPTTPERTVVEIRPSEIFVAFCT